MRLQALTESTQSSFLQGKTTRVLVVAWRYSTTSKRSGHETPKDGRIGGRKPQGWGAARSKRGERTKLRFNLRHIITGDSGPKLIFTPSEIWSVELYSEALISVR